MSRIGAGRSRPPPGRPRRNPLTSLGVDARPRPGRRGPLIAQLAKHSRSSSHRLTNRRSISMALADQVFGFFIPNVSLMGVGSSKQAGAQAKALGATKALIVTDKVLNQLGVAARIRGQLEEAGVKAVVFDGAEPNPTDTNVRDGLTAYVDNRCD